MLIFEPGDSDKSCTCWMWINMFKIKAKKGLKTFSEVSPSKEISDVSTSHGYPQNVYLTFLSHSQ